MKDNILPKSSQILLQAWVDRDLGTKKAQFAYSLSHNRPFGRDLEIFEDICILLFLWPFSSVPN